MSKLIIEGDDWREVITNEARVIRHNSKIEKQSLWSLTESIPRSSLKDKKKLI